MSNTFASISQTPLSPRCSDQTGGMTDAIPAISNDCKGKTIDSRGARPRSRTGMRIPRSRDECGQEPSIGEVRSMRADIVDRGIEHGTAKFIVDGGRCAPVKYDDYDRDEIESRGFSTAR